MLTFRILRHDGRPLADDVTSVELAPTIAALAAHNGGGVTVIPAGRVRESSPNLPTGAKALTACWADQLS